MSVRLTVVGDINIDFVVQANRLPQLRETLRVPGDYRTVPGGKGANQAVAAARLGANVTLVGCIGNDPFGPALVENFRREEINTEYIVQDEETTTGAAFITVMPDGQNAIISALGANLCCTTEQVEAAAVEIERSDMVLVQPGVPPSVVDRAIQIAVDCDVPILLDPSPIGEELPHLWRRAHVLVPNETEAGQLTHRDVTDSTSAIETAKRLRDLGIIVAVITMGPAGCVVASDEGTRVVDGYEVEPVDTTAAGDAFAAAFAVSLAEGMSPPDAALFANAAGALATTVAGAQPSLPTRQAVEQFLHTHKEAKKAIIEDV